MSSAFCQYNLNIIWEHNTVIHRLPRESLIDLDKGIVIHHQDVLA